MFIELTVILLKLKQQMYGPEKRSTGFRVARQICIPNVLGLFQCFNAVRVRDVDFSLSLCLLSVLVPQTDPSDLLWGFYHLVHG